MQTEPQNGLRDPGGIDLSKRFLRLNFVTLWVRDQDRSRRFFVEQLGFRVEVDVEIPETGRWVIVAPPSGLPGIALCAAPDGTSESNLVGQNTGFSFVTENVRAVFEEWSNHGVRFTLAPTEPEWGSGQARFAKFEDPDGNSFSLIEFDEATRRLEAERQAVAARLEAERQAAHELAIAKQVQSRLLPQRQPALLTLDYAGLCLPARAVGGDYFDFLDLGAGHLGLVIGDIVGKGMAAALLMANLQANLRSQSATARDEPLRFLQSVNLLFCDNTDESDFATMFFAEYDDQTRRLRCSNCGHPAGLLLRRDGTLDRLESTSTVLGMFKEWSCGFEVRQLCPGDTLLLYTDGVTESFNQQGEEFGEERLIEVLCRHHGLTSVELLAAVTEEIRRFSPHEQADDITLIAAKGRD